MNCILLDLGLKFIPTVSLIPYSTTIESLQYITRRIALYDHFQNSEKEDKDPQDFKNLFKKKSDWTLSMSQL